MSSSRPSFAPLTEESQVPEYVLPPLLSADGDPASWPTHRRELIALLSDHAYGRTPSAEPEGGIGVHELSRGPVPHASGGTRIQLALDIGPTSNRHRVQVLLYLPAASPTHLYLGLNFAGNHTIDPDPEILLPESWMHPWPDTGVVENRATDAGRGTRSRRWPVGRILEHNAALATFYCGDLAPDQADHPDTASFKRLFPAATDPASDWGNIGIWAWGLCRVREALATLPELADVPCVAVGHSRMGKAALWAGAQDEHFAGVLSNCSGCMGAAISRRGFGETVGKITESFPHWFSPRLRDWAEKESEMPIDQHMLLALIAPRPLLVASASEDLWADPRGEFLGAQAASEAYNLHGYEGLQTDDFPPVDHPILCGPMAYILRTGTHDFPVTIWELALNFYKHLPL